MCLTGQEPHYRGSKRDCREKTGHKVTARGAKNNAPKFFPKAPSLSAGLLVSPRAPGLGPAQVKAGSEQA